MALCLSMPIFIGYWRYKARTCRESKGRLVLRTQARAGHDVSQRRVRHHTTHQTLEPTNGTDKQAPVPNMVTNACLATRLTI